MEKKKTTCKRHNYRLRGYNWAEMEFVCKHCGKQRHRPMTREEYDFYMKEHRWQLHMPIHKLYHRLALKIFEAPGLSFRYTGYELMGVLERFARYNHTCEIVDCDDSSHCSSLMLFVPHEDDTEYWGTTVIIAPQYGEPEHIFLYPHHSEKMLNALKRVHRKFMAKEPIRKAKETDRRRKEKELGFDSVVPKGILLTKKFIRDKKRRQKIKSKKLAKLLDASSKKRIAALKADSDK